MGIGAIVCAMSAASGATISAPDQCRRSVVSTGYYQETVEWDAPATIREVVNVANYERKKAYERLLKSCESVTGPPTITCGPLKCGGIFSTETESTEQREARDMEIRAAERVKIETRRQIEDQPRLERMQRENQEAMFKRLHQRK